MAFPVIPIWKQAPFIRMLFPFAAGIIVQDYCRLPEKLLWIILFSSFLGLLFFAFLPTAFRFKLSWLNGSLLHCFVLAGGCLLTVINDFSPAAIEAEKIFPSRPTIMVSLQEPLSEKPSSYKALAEIKSIQIEGESSSAPFNIILYFRKDSVPPDLSFGDRIVFTKAPQRIKNFTKVGDFNYVRYCALRNIYFQVYLDKSDYIILKGNESSTINRLLIIIRKWVVDCLQKFIPSRKEYGFAEALLIGYKDDLDKNLINAYSNTGVVHVVAISGLHLGLIYALLKYICVPFGKKGALKWLTPLIIIAGLWIFSLLAGAAPSVLRSAVMFTCIVLGENIQKRTSVINNLAGSAFLLLCYNPFWLWDIGFQLSYAALLSIILFMKPLYHLIVFKNKIADTIWQLNAVTLSAQILTVPVSVFYFHQFPNLFLVTNFIAVPLSSIVLMGEIALCGFSFIPMIAKGIGWVVCWLIKMLNGTIEWMDSFAYSTISGINIDLAQLIFVYIMIFATGAWLIFKQNKYVKISLAAVILFMADQFI